MARLPGRHTQAFERAAMRSFCPSGQPSASKGYPNFVPTEDFVGEFAMMNDASVSRAFGCAWHGGLGGALIEYGSWLRNGCAASCCEINWRRADWKEIFSCGSRRSGRRRHGVFGGRVDAGLGCRRQFGQEVAWGRPLRVRRTPDAPRERYGRSPRGGGRQHACFPGSLRLGRAEVKAVYMMEVGRGPDLDWGANALAGAAGSLPVAAPGIAKHADAGETGGRSKC